MGFIIPNMGTKGSVARKARTPSPALGIADALFSKAQRRVLGVLFGNPGRTYFANEVIALAESGTGAVQRELTRLAAAGLVTVKSIGKQKHYQANPASPVFAELRGLMVKTAGVADVLRDALKPVAKRVNLAFVYGSVAKGEDTATSDIDLMIVSDTLTYADIFGRLEDAAERLGRRVNPTVYSPQEFSKRIKQDNAFVTRVLQQPKLWLFGEQRAISGA